jgi:hypothetical protein
VSILNVSLNRIGDEGAKALALNTKLTRLDIDGNDIGYEGAKALSLNTKLTRLDIGSNRISRTTKETIELEKTLKMNTTLTHLNLGDTLNFCDIDSDSSTFDGLEQGNNDIRKDYNNNVLHLLIEWPLIPKDVVIHIIFPYLRLKNIKIAI